MYFFSSSPKISVVANLPRLSALNDCGKSIMSAAHSSNSMDLDIDSEQITYEITQKTIEIFKNQDAFDDDR